MNRILVASVLALGALGAGAQAQDVREIRFAPGASSGTVSGAVVRGTRDVYAFTARKGQTAELRLVSLESNAAFSIWRPGAQLGADAGSDIVGKSLPGAGEGQDAVQWRGRLPDSGRYFVIVGPTRGNATSELRLSIGARPALPRPAAAASLPPK